MTLELPNRKSGSRGDAVVTGQELHAVTGAFGYTGKYITRRLLAAGKRALNLTGHPEREDLFAGRVVSAPFNFDRPSDLARSLTGVGTLYNTYWIRFPRRGVTYDLAVANTEVLVRAAAQAGVRRIVHVSITNASETSPFPYFRGKGYLERVIACSGLSYAIIRPTVIFGAEDILINNIAWLLRRFPVFGLPGRGDYRLQPVFVEDLADLAVAAGASGENVVMDAVGPEVFAFRELVESIARGVGSRARVVPLPPVPAYALSRVIGFAVGDVVLTRDEIGGLMAGLLVSAEPPTAPTRFSDWMAENAGGLGRSYASEVARHYR